MAGMFLYTGNRIEELSRKAAEIVGNDTTNSPFYKEIFLVQTKGMSAWLAMEIAKYGGIFANYEFINLNQLTGKLFFPLAEIYKLGKNPFEGDLKWIIMEELRGGLLEREEFLPLKKYASDAKDSHYAELKLFQLSQKIADSYDQYQISRFDMIEKWNEKQLLYSEEKSDGNEKWQMILWNRIVKKYGTLNRYDITKDLFAALEKTDATAKVREITKRLNIFGLSVIPPIYLELLKKLANHIEVNLFLLNPCREFWFDIKSDRERAKLRKRRNWELGSGIEDHLETGNILLANSGKTGKDFFAMLYDCHFSGEEDLFIENQENLTILKDIQNDILNLNQSASKLITHNDDSIKVISCHSKMREIEILYDNLLAEFDASDTLTPRDIIIMAPDIAEYAPFINAVFGVVSDEKMRIPYRVTDKSLQSESSVADCYLEIVEFLSGRFEVSPLLAIMQNGSILKKAGLSVDDMELVAQWLKDTNVRWGIDAAFKKEVGSNGEDWNTWSVGLDRMMSGYCMYSEDNQFVNNILPYEEIEGQNGIILGKFMDFFDLLKKYRKLFNHSYLLSRWGEIFIEMLTEFFQSDRETEKEIAYIEKMFENLKPGASRENQVICDPATGFEVIKSYLSELMNEDSLESGFISGGVTFCSTKPMRSIPFRIICLLGMNDNAFPRKNIGSAIDLMNVEFRAGDRNPKNSDRYLFLETLLSVRDKLYISYIGRSIKDNSKKMPSILVSELLDYISEGYRLEEKGKEIRREIVQEHPLQPFSRRYFDKKDKLFSYSQENSAVFSTAGTKTEQLELEEEQIETTAELPLTKLIAFFKNPAKYYITEILKARYPEPKEESEDVENFNIDILSNYSITNEMLAKINAAEFTEEKDLKILKAKGILPHGKPGELKYQQIVKESKFFADKLTNYISEGKLAKIIVDKKVLINGVETILSGSIDDIYADALVKFRPTKKEQPKDLIELWLNHLLLNILEKDPYPTKSVFFARETPKKKDCNIEFNLIENPEEKLAKLLAVYEQGIKGFIPFHPELSKSFFDEYQKKNRLESSYRKALSIWQKSYDNFLKDDIYLSRCLKELKFETADEELMENMKDLAQLVFEDMQL